MLIKVAATKYKFLNQEKLLVNTQFTHSFSLGFETRKNVITAIFKTYTIQKAIKDRIIKIFDRGRPLIEVARKMKTIEDIQPH